MIVDFTQQPPRDPQPVLLQPTPKRSWNPFHYLWTAWQHFAYFFAPPGAEPCIYCFLFRMFFIGAACGAGVVWWLK